MNIPDILTLRELTKQNPNDQDLGSTIRSLTHEKNTTISDFVYDFVKMYPNDMELGNELRKKILSHIK